MAGHCECSNELSGYSARVWRLGPFLSTEEGSKYMCEGRVMLEIFVKVMF